MSMSVYVLGYIIGLLFWFRWEILMSLILLSITAAVFFVVKYSLNSERK